MSDLPGLRRLSGVFGCVIPELDVRTADAATTAAVKRALDTYSVVILPGQALDYAAQRQFADALGAVKQSMMSRARGSTEPRTTIRDDAQHPPNRDLWHTDDAYSPDPPRYAMLYGETIPEVGGDTLWVSMRAVHDGLSPALQAWLQSLEIQMHLGPELETIFRESAMNGWSKLESVYTSARHPLVVRTGTEDTPRPSIYACPGMYFSHFVGLAADEGEALKALLQRRIADPNVQVRWSWTPGDLALWDQRSTLHRGLPDHFPRERLMQRWHLDGCAPEPWREVTGSATGTA